MKIMSVVLQFISACFHSTTFPPSFLALHVDVNYIWCLHCRKASPPCLAAAKPQLHAAHVHPALLQREAARCRGPPCCYSSLLPTCDSKFYKVHKRMVKAPCLSIFKELWQERVTSKKVKSLIAISRTGTLVNRVVSLDHLRRAC